MESAPARDTAACAPAYLDELFERVALHVLVDRDFAVFGGNVIVIYCALVAAGGGGERRRGVSVFAEGFL